MRKQSHLLEILLVGFFASALIVISMSNIRITPLMVLLVAVSYFCVNTLVDIVRKNFSTQYLLQYTFNSLLALSVGLLII